MQTGLWQVGDTVEDVGEPSLRVSTAARLCTGAAAQKMMEWTPPPDGIFGVPRWWCRPTPWRRRRPWKRFNIIGIDLAKRSFQLHGARADGSVAFRRKLSREKTAALSRRTSRAALWRWRPVRALTIGAERL